MSGALAASTSNLAGLANVLQTLFLGSNKSESGTTTKTDTTTGTSSVRSDQSVIDQLQQLFDGALANAKNPEAVKPVVENILRQAQLAFTPQLGREAQSGLYNTTARKQLADQAVADATGASAQAVLNYVTQQQQIAGQTGNTLANAAKTTSGTSTGTTSAATGSKARTASAIPSNIGSIAGLGLAGYSLYKNKDKLLDNLGIGSGGNTPIDLISSPNVLDTIGQTATMTPELAAGLTTPGSGLFSVAADGTMDIPQSVLDTITQTGGGPFSGAGASPVVNFTDALDLTGTEAGTELLSSGVADINSLFDFTGMEDLGSSLGDLGAGAFDLTDLLGSSGGFFDDVFEILGGIF